MTVGELLERVSSRELSEWMAYYALEPFGQERGDLQAGVVASVMANAWKGAKERRTFEPGDFMLQFGKQKSTTDYAATLTDYTDEEKREKARELYKRFRAWAKAS